MIRYPSLIMAAALVFAVNAFSQDNATASAAADATTDSAHVTASAPAAATIDSAASTGSNDDKKSAVQNAVLEGVQLSAEQGASPDEKNVTCYFIFRDKPTNYFYSFNKKEKKLVFEFNDVEKGTSPIDYTKEAPITGFRVETEKADANKDVQGLNPEWHDIMKVSFFLDALPIIAVKDEFSVISFSYKWSSDPAKQKLLAQKDDTKKKHAIIAAFAGTGVVAAGVAVTLMATKTHTGTPQPGDISTSDLPSHTLSQ